MMASDEESWFRHLRLLPLNVPRNPTNRQCRSEGWENGCFASQLKTWQNTVCSWCRSGNVFQPLRTLFGIVIFQPTRKNIFNILICPLHWTLTLRMARFPVYNFASRPGLCNVIYVFSSKFPSIVRCMVREMCRKYRPNESQLSLSLCFTVVEGLQILWDDLGS